MPSQRRTTYSSEHEERYIFLLRRRSTWTPRIQPPFHQGSLNTLLPFHSWNMCQYGIRHSKFAPKNAGNDQRGQSLQLTVAGFGAFLPGKQLWQTAWPVTFAKRPGAQSWQTLRPNLKTDLKVQRKKPSGRSRSRSKITKKRGTALSTCVCSSQEIRNFVIVRTCQVHTLCTPTCSGMGCMCLVYIRCSSRLPGRCRCRWDRSRISSL